MIYDQISNKDTLTDLNAPDKMLSLLKKVYTLALSTIKDELCSTLFNNYIRKNMKTISLE